MTQKQKGYVGLGVMVVLAGATVFLSNPLYNAIDTMAAKSISYTPGSYMGSADGFGGKVTATVTISENGIDAIVLAGNDETPELGGAALEKLAPKFMEAQSSQVDAVSGCTITSNAAMEAVQNALDQASERLTWFRWRRQKLQRPRKLRRRKRPRHQGRGDQNLPGRHLYGTAKGFGGDVTATVVITDSGIESVELVGNDETEELGGAALKKLSKKFVEAQTSTVDAVSGCTITSDAAMAAVEQALEQAAGGAADAGSTAVEAVSYAAGTYTGTAKGFGGDVNATVVITDSGIESVELVGNDETEELGGAALKKLSKKFVEAQSSKVDAVSGCTITSDAAMEAVKQALDQAK
ncbi:MAG: FMN-binding protein [Hungatella hathewayi]